MKVVTKKDLQGWPSETRDAYSSPVWRWLQDADPQGRPQGPQGISADPPPEIRTGDLKSEKEYFNILPSFEHSLFSGSSEYVRCSKWLLKQKIFRVYCSTGDAHDFITKRLWHIFSDDFSILCVCHQGYPHFFQMLIQSTIIIYVI